MINNVHSCLRYPGIYLQGMRDKIFRVCPLDFDNYYEPFCGGCNWFFHYYVNYLSKVRANIILSDKHDRLISALVTIKNNPDDILESIKCLMRQYDINDSMSIKGNLSDIEKTSLYIYLNRRETEFIHFADSIHKCSEMLVTSNIICGDYRTTTALAKSGDFILIEPPHLSDHYIYECQEKNNELTSFLFRDEFGMSDLYDLYDYCHELTERQIFFVLTSGSNIGNRLDRFYCEPFGSKKKMWIITNKYILQK